MPEAMGSGKKRALRLACCIAAVMFIGVASADECAPEPQGEGRVAAAIDARTLRLDDGRIVRLAGLAPLEPQHAAAATEALAAITVDRAVSIHAEADAPDRYGRQVAWVFADGANQSVQSTLIAAGGGLRDASPSDRACRDDLAKAEKAARNARLGLWAAPSVLKNAETPGDISAGIGHFMVVAGRVRSVRQTAGTNYLNFGRRWIEGFAVMVPSRTAQAFESAGMSLKGLEGRRVQVRGFVMQRGGPRIEALNPQQIELADGDSAVTSGNGIE